MKRALLSNRVLLGLSTMALLLAACSGETVDELPDVERVEWTIEVSEYAPSPGTVTLKGDVPLGFPTETWKDDVLLARTVDARAFEWNMDASPEVPIPVNEIDGAGDCDELQTLLEEWADATASAPGDARRAEAQAFAQHALDTMQDQGCEVDLG